MVMSVIDIVADDYHQLLLKIPINELESTLLLFISLLYFASVHSSLLNVALIFNAFIIYSLYSSGLPISLKLFTDLLIASSTCFLHCSAYFLFFLLLSTNSLTMLYNQPFKLSPYNFICLFKVETSSYLTLLFPKV